MDSESKVMVYFFIIMMLIIVVPIAVGTLSNNSAEEIKASFVDQSKRHVIEVRITESKDGKEITTNGWIRGDVLFTDSRDAPVLLEIKKEDGTVARSSARLISVSDTRKLLEKAQ